MNETIVKLLKVYLYVAGAMCVITTIKMVFVIIMAKLLDKPVTAKSVFKMIGKGIILDSLFWLFTIGGHIQTEIKSIKVLMSRNK